MQYSFASEHCGMEDVRARDLHPPLSFIETYLVRYVQQPLETRCTCSQYYNHDVSFFHPNNVENITVL